MAATDIRQSLAAYVKLFEEMTPQSVDTLADYFAPGAVFQDPFNAVRGTEPITRIFQHMYEVCEQPRFRVNSSVLEGDTAWLHWDFSFSYRQRPMNITGASMVRFSEDGLVTMHIDYWDAASQLYEKLPLIGWLFRRLHRLFSVPQPALSQ